MPLAAKIASHAGFVTPSALGSERSRRPGDRKDRVARVIAKRPKKAGTDKPEAGEGAEQGIESEAMEPAEGDVEAKPQRPESGTYLSMYFRDMARLDVLRPEEEFTSARELEALEIELWEAVFSHPPVLERVLDALATVPD